MDESAADKLSLAKPAFDIGIVCSDFERSREFYQRALGFEIDDDLEIPESVARRGGFAPSHFHHLRLRAGQAQIKLMEIYPPPLLKDSGFRAGVGWITFIVQDLTESLSKLEDRGVVSHTGIIEGVRGRFACIRDPDEITIELVELYTGS